MSLRLIRRNKARRAAPDVVGQEQLSFENENLTIRSIVKQGLAAVAVSALGLVMAGGVALASSAQAEEATSSSVTATNAGADVTRAEPAVDSQGFDSDTQAAIDEQGRGADGDDADAGTLTTFDGNGRSDTTSRSAARSQLDAAVASQQKDTRTSTLSKANENAALTAQAAARENRDDELADDLSKVAAEAKRIAAEKKKAEKKLKKKGLSSADVDAIVPADATSKGGAAPLKKGTYTVGAHWGEYGSWSRYHTGQDLSAPTGTPIYAVADGVVGSPTGGGWAGNHVILHHSGGVSTLYAHMSATAVSKGDVIKAGQLIGYVGSTGRSFGAHLHLEYYPAGTTPGDVYSTSDPMVFLAHLGVRM